MSAASERLALIRSSLASKKIDAYLITSTDPHLDEEVSDHWKVIKWLTGFTGSSATVIVTPEFAGLWTDSRYFIQAERELRGSGFSLVKPDSGPGNNYTDYLFELLDQDDIVGLDGKLLSISQFRKMKLKLDRKGIKFDLDCDLVSDHWSERPPLPDSLAFDHSVDYCGKSREKKISEVREKMKTYGAEWQLLTSREDIMWLLNIRGNDLKYTPVIDSFVIIGMEQVLLFVEERKIPFAIAAEFDRIGVVILPYEEAWNVIPSVTEKSALLLDPSTVSVYLYNSVSVNSEILEDISVPARLKSVKNKSEIENLIKVMIKDGTALTRFLYWVENNSEEADEYRLAQKINEFRSLQAGFLGPSFAPIVAYGENSALPHYTPSEGSDTTPGDSDLLLIDSGGQYTGGTTDITRTICTGTASRQQIMDFTLVLKGHIAIATAKFPHGTRGYQIDVLARKALWESGMNYGHGTGHGIGFCLNVHEGPQSISPSDNRNILEAGMVISNEPAVYKEGKYGIRTENVMLCYEDEETEFGQFLRFDTISLCYIDKALIDKSLLDRNEILWINSYHSEVYDKISPFLNDDEREWLKGKTEPL